MESKRVQVILTNDINEAFKNIAKEQNSNVSAMVRLALVDWLDENHNIKLEHRLAWGGDRSPSCNPTVNGAG